MIVASRQLYAGAIFLAIGALAFAQATQYRLGSAFHMGPGYFPICLSILLMMLGIAAIIQDLMIRRPKPLAAWEWRDLALLVSGVVLFALLIDRAGLLAASAGLIVTSCATRLLSRPIEVLIVWAVLTVFCGVIFIEIFGLPFQWL
jgi:putative tricarboxylic transport membrane protein